MEKTLCKCDKYRKALREIAEYKPKNFNENDTDESWENGYNTACDCISKIAINVLKGE